MEAGGSGTWQSGFSSARNPAHPESPPKDTFERSHQPAPAMATATLISPSASYSSHHPFTSAYNSSGSHSNIHGMTSPTGSRRTPDEADARNRQSLPSIQEVISSANSGPYSATSSAPSSTSLLSPFSTSAPTRPFSDTSSESHVPPRTLHPPPPFPPRSEPMSAFQDPVRSALSGRPPPPPPPPPSLSTYPGQPGPPEKMEYMEREQRQVAEAPQYDMSYTHQPQQSGPAVYPGQVQPGLGPITSYPAAPFDPQRASMYGEEDFAGRGNKYEGTLNRAFEAWNYGDALVRAAGSARTIFHFAEAFGAAAREQHGAQPIPSRLPTEDELGVMLNNVHMVKKCLEDVRSMVQQSRISSERARETNIRKPFEEDETGYSEAAKVQYSMGEVKRRRGRVAPPGRCHSCNRVDTPEWRRGPDGARTLCNACGLHYAKLERKRQMEQRSIRPKPSGERS